MTDTSIIVEAVLSGVGTFLYLTGRDLRREHEKRHKKT